MAKTIKRAVSRLITTKGVVEPGERLKFRLPKKEMEQLEALSAFREEEVDDDLIRDAGDAADPEPNSGQDEPEDDGEE